MKVTRLISLHQIAMAGEPGFEPRLTESESVVLPLNYSPIEILWHCLRPSPVRRHIKDSLGYATPLVPAVVRRLHFSLDHRPGRCFGWIIQPANNDGRHLAGCSSVAQRLVFVA